MKYIHVMSVAGSDCSGGAGIQADIKTISALGGYASSVITAVTAQNTCGVTHIHPVPAETVQAQMQAIIMDMPPDAIKIGMVTDCDIITAISREISKNSHFTIVFDPVLMSSSGVELVCSEGIRKMCSMLLPQCFLLTPNLPEAEILSGVRITDQKSLHRAARVILDMGCKNVLIKGGHRTDGQMTDVLLSHDRNEYPRLFEQQQIITQNSHGTGCTLSSAIATFLAAGLPVDHAVAEAKKYLTEALKSGSNITIGHGHGPVNHFFNPKRSILR